MIINDDKLLVMQSEKVSYFYLPGGRVKLNETAQEAIIREIYEELQIKAKIISPLWFNQAFFQEDVDDIRYMKYAFIFYLILVKILANYMKVISQQMKKIKFIILHG